MTFNDWLVISIRSKAKYSFCASATFCILRTSLSIVFSVQGTGGSPTGPDPENRVGDQDIGSQSKPVSSGLQVSGEPFPFWLG
jgi:hypothetical protein